MRAEELNLLVEDVMLSIAQNIQNSELKCKQLLDESLNSKDSSGMGYEKTIQAWLFNGLYEKIERSNARSKGEKYLVQIERKFLRRPQANEVSKQSNRDSIADIIIKKESELFNREQASLIIELGHQHLNQGADLKKKFENDFKKWHEFSKVLHIQIVTSITRHNEDSGETEYSLSEFDIEEAAVSKSKSWDWLSSKKGKENLENLAASKNDYKFKYINGNDEINDPVNNSAVSCVFKNKNQYWLFKVWFIVTKK